MRSASAHRHRPRISIETEAPFPPSFRFSELIHIFTTLIFMNIAIGRRRCAAAAADASVVFDHFNIRIFRIKLINVRLGTVRRDDDGFSCAPIRLCPTMRGR